MLISNGSKFYHDLWEILGGKHMSDFATTVKSPQWDVI